jgi:hypothetical protein
VAGGVRVSVILYVLPVAGACRALSFGSQAEWPSNVLTLCRLVIPAGPSRVLFSSAHFVTWAQPDCVLDRIAVNGHGELRHGIRTLRVHVVLPELRHGNGHGLVQALGIDIDAMKNAVWISEGHAAAGTGHEADYSALFAFCSP